MGAMNKKIIYLIALVATIAVAAGAVYSIVKTHTITVNVQEPLAITPYETIEVSGYPGQEVDAKVLDIENKAPVNYNILYDFYYSTTSGLSVKKLVIKEGENVIKEVNAEAFKDSDNDGSFDVSFTLEGSKTVSIFVVVGIDSAKEEGNYSLYWMSREITRS